MINVDKFLIGIIVTVAAIVGAALAVTLMTKPTYQPEDNPKGVAHNYLLALKQGDFERSYSYLSPTLKGYPASAEAFAADIRQYSWKFRLEDTSTTLEAESASISGDQATVTVRETHLYNHGLYSSDESTYRFKVYLQSEAGAWRIIRSESYWLSRWEGKQGYP